MCQMCYWLGCPMIGEDESKNDVLTAAGVTQEAEDTLWEKEEAVDS